MDPNYQQYLQQQQQYLQQQVQQQSQISAQQIIQKEKEEEQLRSLLIEQLKAAADLAQKVVSISNKVLGGDEKTQSLAAECRSCAFQLAFLLEGVKIDV